MENLTLAQIKGLAAQTQNPSISIFLPTHHAGQDTQLVRPAIVSLSLGARVNEGWAVASSDHLS